MLATESRIKTVEAYQCTCGKAYLTRSSAEICCTPKKCAGCGCEIEKKSSRSFCNDCREKTSQSRWECAEKAPASFILYSDFLDNYFTLDEYLDDPYYALSLDDLDLDDEIEDQEIARILALPHDEIARKYRIYLTNPHVPSPINLCEYYDEYCDEDGNLPGDWDKAEAAITQWIESVDKSHCPVVYSKIAWSGQCQPSS